ncbi:MAG: ABC transporter ATP-binding protein [Spirochaetales bacterium]
MSVRLDHITKVFPDPHHPGKEVVAVRNVSIDVKEGEFVTFLGPSGCGKTTTLRIISGFEYPTEGEVWISGKMVNNDPPNKRDTSMVFQSYAIFPHLSVAQNIGFGLDLKGVPKETIRKETERIMEVMNLSSLANRRPDQLSGGQQQRVALARAIVNKPSVLLFDEPLSNLDAKLREQMRLEIRRIQKTFGITSIYVTHDQGEAMTVSDRIVVMNEGNIMQVGTPFEIYSRPANWFVADFIGRVNFFEGVAEEATDENTSIRFPHGAVREVASGTRSFHSGEQVLVVVRPESLKLYPEDAAKGEPFLEGKIEKVVYLGSVCEYEIDVGWEKPVLAVTHNPIEEGFFNPGDRVGIDFSPISAHALPADS